MKTWQDIYDVISQDANGVGHIYVGGEKPTMCVLGGLAQAAGLDLEGRWRAHQATGGFRDLGPLPVFTREAIDWVIKHYPLSRGQCDRLYSKNDSYYDIAERRAALISLVQTFEAEEMS